MLPLLLAVAVSISSAQQQQYFQQQFNGQQQFQPQFQQQQFQPQFQQQFQMAPPCAHKQEWYDRPAVPEYAYDRPAIPEYAYESYEPQQPFFQQVFQAAQFQRGGMPQPQFPQQQFQQQPQQFQQPQFQQFPQQQQQFNQMMPQQQFQQQQQFFPQQQPQQQQFAQQQQFVQQPQRMQFQQVQQPMQQFQPQPQPQQPQQFQQQPFQQPQQPRVVQQVFREQPSLVEQQRKITQSRRPAPQIFNTPTVTQPRTQTVHAPPPPDKFIPYPSDIYSPNEKQVHQIKNGHIRPTVINTDANVDRTIIDSEEPTMVSNGSELESADIEEIPVISVQPKQRPQQIQQRPQQVQAPVRRPPPPPPAPLPRQKTRPAPVQAPPPPPPQPVSVLQATMDGGDSGSASGGSKSANAVFLTCCKKRGVHKKCESRCNFDIMNKKVLTGMFLGTDPCPQQYGRDLMSCAAQDKDHSQCCRDQGVHTTSAGDKCLGFCNMTPGNSFQADVSYLPCWAVLTDIKNCFKDFIET